MQIIGITGRKGSGKDTFAEAMINEGWTPLKFAGPLKEMLKVLLRSAAHTDNHIDRLVDGDWKEVPLDCLSGKTPRHAMQTLGTEWREMIGADLWTNILRQHLMSEPTGHFVVTDVRFAHEVTMLKDLGAKIVRIEGHGEANQLSAHASEQEIDNLPVDAVVHNNGSIADLHRVALNLAKGI